MEKINSNTPKRLRLNLVHRYVGIVIAPFLVIQTLSGLLLDFGPFQRSGLFIGEEQSLVWRWFSVQLMSRIHFGPGLINDIYHILLGAGIVWMGVSGWLLFLKGRRARRNLAKKG